MLRRFCLYGFLKNQQYYDAFLLLALLGKGLSFTEYGLLIGCREICINLLEVPTGAVADVLGRRKSMVASMLAYVAAFSLFATTDTFALLFAAMALFSAGEAFRTGTHKAIIFDWLAREGREDEKTATYGLTRSWSKLGSAVSAAIAGALVFVFKDYDVVFWACLVPYGLNVINLATYPAWLDGPHDGKASVAEVFRALSSAIAASWRRRPLRRLLIESMGFEGLYKATKDYIQPIIQSAVIALPIAAARSTQERTAVAVAAVAVAVHGLSSVASRHAGAFASRAGGEPKAGRRLWAADLAIFAAMGAGAFLGWPYLMVGTFVLLAVAQNFWRPILVGRCAAHADADRTATVLSIESQAKSLFVAVVAPALGWAADAITAAAESSQVITHWWRFLPIAVIGIVIPIGMLATGRRGDYDRPPTPDTVERAAE
ncbi:MAG: MFS transporter [Planctomycetota bacterium]|jgi:MFS family permease